MEPLRALIEFVSLGHLASDVVTGLIGGVLLFIFEWVVRWCRHLYLNFKYPVGGHFVTFYDNGNSTPRVRCYSVLKQRGREIHGKTWLAEGRAWHLEGKIMGGGHVAGAYTADAPEDHGVGAFYFSISRGDLEGVWAGYDHESKRTTVGKYELRREMRVRIVRYQEAHRPAVLSILTDTLGAGYLSDVGSALSRPGAVAFVAIGPHDVCGFAYGYVAGKGELTAIMAGGASDATPDIHDADTRGTLGVVRTLAVAPSAQGRGVGSKLLRELETSLWRAGATTLVAPAWKYGSTIHVRGLLDQASYRQWTEVPLFWKTECDRGDFKCPARTAAGCQCDVVGYRKVHG